jgi:hypothetical protein
MMIVSTRVVVTNEAQQIVPPSKNPTHVKILNVGAEVVRVGPNASVSPTDAWGINRLPDSPNVPRNVYEFDLPAGEEMWAVVASGSAAINLWYQTN